MIEYYSFLLKFPLKLECPSSLFFPSFNWNLGVFGSFSSIHSAAIHILIDSRLNLHLLAMVPQNLPAQPFQPQSNSIFYVHSSDGHNFVTITFKIDDNNYAIWRRSMCRALWAKHKLPIIDISLEIPDFDDLNWAAWGKMQPLGLFLPFKICIWLYRENNCFS